MSIIFQLLSLKRDLFSFQIITQIWSCLTALKKILRNVSVKLLKNICSLEELITAVPLKEGEMLLFGLAELEDNSKFISLSRPEDVEFFLKSTRNLLFGIEEARLSMKMLNISPN